THGPPRRTAHLRDATCARDPRRLRLIPHGDTGARDAIVRERPLDIAAPLLLRRDGGRNRSDTLRDGIERSTRRLPIAGCRVRLREREAGKAVGELEISA